MTVAILVVLGAALYGPLLRAAARVPFLEREVERLTEENQRVTTLARALERAEERYAQLRTMLGTDAVPALQPMERANTPIAPVIVAGEPRVSPRYESGGSVPRHWPLGDYQGFVTRGLIGPGGDEEAHFGVDIAIPIGTPVRAAGGGSVEQVGRDADYGLFVLVTHPEGYQTMYGHASRLLVARGDRIAAGQVIALSGNTGRSTAPHLHFELRRSGSQVDPMSVLREVP